MIEGDFNERGYIRTPADQARDDAERRARAQSRRPIISKWAIDVPAGYIHVDDAIEYMRRRWGNALRAEILERFSREKTGPLQFLFGESPDRRGERYYKFDDVDLWVWRTVSGVPASYLETRTRKSTVPVLTVEDAELDTLMQGVRDGKEQGRIRAGSESDGRQGREANPPENSNGGETGNGSEWKASDGSSGDGSRDSTADARWWT